jgi:glycosyltransferase involved in cell wall biosynthesis
MYPRKNHAALLQAAASLRPRFPQLRVRLVGDGPERPRLDRLATRLGLGTTVQFTGQVSFDRLVREYAACDVFCLPTLQEGFGLVFAEAMTAGKPVVACRAGAVPEVVGPDTGILVDPTDDGALPAALGALLGDPERRQALGQAGQREAIRRFGLARAAAEFLSAVGSLPACQERAPAQ